MKCRCCNAPITVEDEFCPHCGAVNEGARKHIADMKKYSRDYAATKAEVMGNVEKQHRKHGLIITACILALLNIVAVVGSSLSWDIKYDIGKIKARAHAAEYEALVQEYETTGQYFELDKLYNDYDLYDASDALKNYFRTADVARSFCDFLDNLYCLRSGNYGYYTLGDLISRMSGSVLNIYNTLESRNYNVFTEYFEGSHGEAMDDIQHLLEQVLMDRCGLTEDDIEALPTLDNNGISLLLGRRMGYYE